MKRLYRKNIEIFNLSFLDVISCGFGAIILLLIISKISQPMVIEENTSDLKKVLIEKEQKLEKVQGEIKQINKKLSISENQITDSKQSLSLNSLELTALRSEFSNAKNSYNAQTIIKEKLTQARQKLTDEMKRLQKNSPVNNKDNTIGGISVDSEYIIFIIDTSGSMRNYAWPIVRRKLKEILDVHPNVKGIQIMNDMGGYMYSQYSGRWIPDTAGRRRAILKRLSSWEPFSNSSPEEGITRAIRQFYATDKQISLYVFGDDFSRGSIQSLLNTVERLNKTNKAGKKRVRINAVGFPVLFNHPGTAENIARFSALMRKITENNNGSFVGVTRLK
ncbi:MAG: VWA domain-containing protein [Gammaproteobacteria bacterium]|nr:VWA domain-containing protein [Gammaproteobacteria bacterium]